MVVVMKKLVIGLILVIIMLSPVYSVSGFAITYGETTYANADFKNSMNDCFVVNCLTMCLAIRKPANKS